MVPSVQETLFRHITERLPTYQHGWEQTSIQLNERLRHRDTTGIQEAICALMQTHAMTTRVVDADRPLLYGELNTGAPATLFFYTSYDTGSQAPEQAMPFSAVLAAVEAYQTAIGPLPINLKWLFDGAGTRDDTHLETIIAELREILQANGGIFWTAEPGEMAGEEGVALLAVGTKGHLRVELSARTANKRLHAMHGTIAADAAWRLTWALNSLKDAREDILIEGFYDTLQPAGDDEVELLHMLPDTSRVLARQWGLGHMLADLRGFQMHYARLLMPGCTITSIDSGRSRSNSIPAQARARVEFSLVPGQEPQDIFAKLQGHLQQQGFADIQVRLLSAMPAARTPLSDPFVQTVRRASRAAYGPALHVMPMTAGSYPLYPFRAIVGMPCVILSATAKREQAKRSLAAEIKQIALILEGMKDGTQSTE